MGKCGVFLHELLPNVPYEENFSLSEHTTIGTGGGASAFFPKDIEQLTSFTRLCNRCKIPFFVLGKGSNILPCDGEYENPVLLLSSFNHIAADGEFVTAESGVSVGKLLHFCLGKSLGGVEFLCGIPAFVGGLVYMNGGTAEGHISDIAESVTCLTDGKILTYSREECAFDYKVSRFQREKSVILSVKFKLKKTDREEIKKRTQEIILKRAHLPKGKSMGCVFKNPYPSLSAGQLIEFCGLKGEKVGGAVLSSTHANFIINEENATSAEIKTLIARVKNRVYERTGIILVEEIGFM